MKITAFDELYSRNLGTGTVYLGGSNGSNSGFAGGDVVGEPGDLSVVGLRRTVALSSNLTGGIGDVLTIIATNPRTAQFATPSNSGSVGSNAMTRTGGGASARTALGTVSTNQVLMIGGANYFTMTLSASIAVSFTGWPATGNYAQIGVRITEDGTGGWTPTFSGVTWLGGTTPSHTTTASTATEYEFWTDDGGATVFGGELGAASGTSSPLTTKGDLYTYSTTNARLAVGSNGTGVIADSAETVGIRWTLQALAGELLMADGVTGPPVPIESDPAQNDWLYADL